MTSLVWLKQFLPKLKFCEIQQMRMYCDNQAIFHVGSDPHERTKHIQIDTVILFEKSYCRWKYVPSLLALIFNW